ncbi:MAG: hypothetical protein ACLFV3_05000 [Phycisphaeraceae bacterium]
MTGFRRWHGWILVAAVATLAWTWPGLAQEDASPDPSRDEVDRLLEEREAPPVVEPDRSGDVQPVPGRAGAPTPEVKVDPSVVGVAPDQPQPQLRREGEFIVNRRGHLRSSDGTHTLFVFESDGEDAAEPPMILQPCRYLETMEDIARERGDQVSFILSGQVFTYRGANYLLPTMMRPAEDRGNLQP